MKALVLIKFASLETRQAYRRLRSLQPVLTAYMMYGRFDALLIIQAENLEEIRRIILSEIQTVPGVVETLPCIIVEDDKLPMVDSFLQPQAVQDGV